MTRDSGVSRRRALRCIPALMAVALLGVSGCGDDPDPRIGLSVTATPESGGPATPITIRSRVENSGRLSVRFWTDCGGAYVADVRLTGPDGRVVDPCRPPGPACPPGPADLEPGHSAEASIVFTGLLCGSEVYAAPPGLYTVQATFTYSYVSDGHEEGDAIVDVTTFQWE